MAKGLLMVLVAGGSLLALCSTASPWQANVKGTLVNGSDGANAVTVDSVGNVVAAGFTENNGTDLDFTVVKFRGVSGVELWRQVVHGNSQGTGLSAFDSARAVAVDGAGDVLAAGYTRNTGTGQDFTVAKFAGATGMELWRYVINGNSADSGDVAVAVAVDASGDVVAAGRTQNTTTSVQFTVAKVAGSSGAQLWRHSLTHTGASTNSIDVALDVTVDAAGDVVAAGFTQGLFTGNDFTVVKLAGSNGVELWRSAIRGTANGDDQARAVTVDRSGNVVAAGFTENGATSYDFTVVKLAASNGVELWRRVSHGTATPSGSKLEEAVAVAVDAQDNVVAAGTTQNTGSFFDFSVVKLNGTDGTSYCVLRCFPSGF
jgi:uncharacterized delta-60 repeat protein